MKLLLFAATALMAGVADVKNVYILQMSSGLDQYIALRLTTGAVLQVVTDPQKADAVLTDRIGQSFEAKLDDLYGKKSENPVSLQPVRRIQGAVFLVDRKTRDVLWSDFERPKGTSPEDLNRAAEKIVKQLEKDRKAK